MRHSFARLDDSLIEGAFQPVSDIISERFGLDRLRAACFCLDGASLAWVLSRAGILSDALRPTEIGSACLQVLLLVLGLVALTSLRTLFHRVAGSRAANPLRAAMLPHRAVVLALIVAQSLNLTGMPDLAGLAMLGLAAAALYFSACTSRPPARRRVGRLADAKA